MGQINCITNQRKYKHFIERERYKLEGYLEAKLTMAEIVKKMHKHRATIYREVKRGLVGRINTELVEYSAYRADVAQRDYENKVSNRERSLKIGKDKEFEEYIRKMILEEKCSPDAIIGRIKQKGLKFKGMVCTKTLYNYVDRGIFNGISNANLWEKRKKKKKKYKKIQRVSLKNKGCRSIEERPEKITDRLEYGHWEGDCIKGPRKEKPGLFTLTERMSREQIIIKIRSLSQESIIKEMDVLESKYQECFKNKFKSITLDNGREFLDWKTMERSELSDKRRTLVYFAHPYSSWERGTNENQNRMIRRFIPKGTDIAKISNKEVQRIEDWMNNYPRKILGYKTAKELVSEFSDTRCRHFN